MTLIPFSFKVCKVIFTLKPDIVNAGTPKAGFLFTLAGYLLRTNVRIYHIRGFRHESLLGFRRTFQVLIEKITCQLATHVICLSPSVKDLLIRENLCEASKAYVLGNGGSGTILENFCPEYFSFEDKSVLKANLNISKDELIFGFVGRLVERKGIYDLLDAWSQLKKNIPNSKLLIIGPFEDAQPMLQAYKDLIYNDDSIVYVGQQSNVSQFMSLMDIFCLPAHWEGFGNVLIEAAAMGLPVISTNGTGTRDAVSDGFNGLLTKVKDVDGLLNAMLTYANSLKLRELHGRNGRIWAKNFDRKIVVLNLANFYKSIL